MGKMTHGKKTNFDLKVSRKEEFDAWFDGFLARLGANPEQKEQIKRKTAAFKKKSAEFADIVQNRAKEGRKQGESITAFKERKLKALNIVANAINELSE